MARFSSKEKIELANLVSNGGLVRVRGNVATCHMFGGYYFIKKTEDGYKYRFVYTNVFEDNRADKTLKHVQTIGEIR